MKERKEIAQFSMPEMVIEEKKARKELQQLRFRGVLGYLENPLKKRTLRKRIARIATRLQELKGE